MAAATPTFTSQAAARGALLGNLIGDAAGATLEFYRGPITAAVADGAMDMPGGGVFDVAPGQITDDGELALSLAHTLARFCPADGFPLGDVAISYSGWRLSGPFDMGATCSLAFSSLAYGAGNTPPPATEAAATMAAAAARGSAPSEANGALMRIAPLAVWAAHELPATIAAYARLDAQLSHPNRVCQDCNVLYCLALQHLILHPGDRAGALATIERFAAEPANAVSDKVRTWLAESTSAPADCTKLIGHVRWGFTLAMHFLRQGTSFADGLRSVLMAGGDTDTNAAIACAVLGAMHGEGAIPAPMKEALLRCQPNHGRPAEYWTKQAPELADRLFSAGDGGAVAAAK